MNASNAYREPRTVFVDRDSRRARIAGYTGTRMGRIRIPPPVKLIAGLLSFDVDLLRRARQLMSREFGRVDLESPVWPFTDTDYYVEEMGTNLLRQFIAFEQPISSDRLVEAKIESNAIEQRIAEDFDAIQIARPVNIDPGFVDPARLVLATTKDRAHRIHLGRGIHAEVTLQFVKGAWRELPWTYPDYHRAEYQEFLTQARTRLLQQNPGTYDERATSRDTISDGSPQRGKPA